MQADVHRYMLLALHEAAYAEFDKDVMELLKDGGAYRLLNVNVNATPPEIKRGYRLAAAAAHPDRNPGSQLASVKFRAVTKAYTILKDPRARALYDAGQLKQLAGEEKMSKLGYDASFPQAVHDIFLPVSDDVFVSPWSVIKGGKGRRKFRFDPNSTKKEGRWRLRDPNSFVPGSYFRVKSSTPGISYIMGRDKRAGKIEIQAIRFDKRKFNERSAAKWWFKNKNRFKREWEWPKL